MEKKTLVENIEELVKLENKVVKYSCGGFNFEYEIKEDAGIDDIHNAIETIVANVEDEEFSYDMIDYMMGYYIIDLFTNIPVPMADDAPDFEKCNIIVAKLRLDEVICDISPVAGSYLSILQLNVWRKLEYKKALASLIPFETLMDALGEFYNILDELDTAVESQKDIDIDELKTTIEDFTGQLSKLNPELAAATDKTVDIKKKK